MKPRDVDPTTEAARIMREVAAKHTDDLPKDLEAAWDAWSRSIHTCDARTRTLLREAFEAGAEAGRKVRE